METVLKLLWYFWKYGSFTVIQILRKTQTFRDIQWSQSHFYPNGYILLYLDVYSFGASLKYWSKTNLLWTVFLWNCNVIWPRGRNIHFYFSVPGIFQNDWMRALKWWLVASRQTLVHPRSFYEASSSLLHYSTHLLENFAVDRRWWTSFLQFWLEEPVQSELVLPLTLH
jgi:hypothetical protein